jgi:hypothetical protein
MLGGTGGWGRTAIALLLEEDNIGSAEFSE